ncbi:zinc finger protein 438 isoform X1 [Alligator mississippiensis]|uniref:zinc finger protein 438 isoform X1 n=2 Tax=Alligator mississippiensis TaxID=8496 RepID=UPI002877FA70|nr:zinc finger protein 438 isoform X1 [Alligator mississippiensis]XP_019353881.2 zinc finger protein 438 isoform X1 [Alligator mississippiensis]XP_019353896.2 zinc finger protein 438 isoform X1 [Alligator mississippiensis]XP_059585112.1 zinc finger protein 438 isoform X1 [Alligator mississippiensis]
MMQNPLTVSGDKSSSGTIQSGKGFQNKSHFRTIAPKMVLKVTTSGMVSCLQPSLPEQSTPVRAASSKPLIVPTQNYALMQVTGHEGTFSLVALPQVTPALTQQIHQSNMSPSENLKLPIPRYQSVRSKLLIDKKPTQTTASGTHNKILVKTRTSSQMPPVTTSTEDHSETHSMTRASEQMILLDQGSTEVTVATLLSESNNVESEPPLLSKTDTAKANVSEPSAAKEPLSKPVGVRDPLKLNLHSMETANETTEGSIVVCEKVKEKTVNSANSVTVLSPAVLGNPVQLTPSTPKGKLPILPYSRMKKTMFYKSKPNSNIANAAAPVQPSDCEKMPSLVKTLTVSSKVSGKLLPISFAQVSKQPTCENALCPASKVDVDNPKKLNAAALKRRGRKQRIPDDILAFQTKRKKRIVNKFREGKEKIKVDPQEPKHRKGDEVKKYRSIRPKPVVVMQALAPQTSAAIIGSKSDQVKQDTYLNNSLPNKYLSYKQSEDVSAKPSDLCRNIFSTVPKMWHKCHVCNHSFQFKHHLQDHMNTHTNRRPYSCRICRKAYIHSGSLSTHMKLHHSEGRLKKLVCCEFCSKVFGHAKVYFGHLREVHRVVISTELSTSEQQLQDALKIRDINIKGADESIERENKCNFEDLFHSQGEVKVQIKCGQCQFTALSFAEMKFHLLRAHGEEIQGRIKDGILQGGMGPQEELIKHAAHFWKQHNERRKLVKRAPYEEFYTFPKLRRQICLHHENNGDVLTKNEVIQSGNSEPAKELQNIGSAPQTKKIQIWSKAGYNCILCKQVFGRKEDLCGHWQSCHNCEDPSVLWTIFNSFFKQGVSELSNTEK